MLDGRPVRRISAYLVEGDLDTSPMALAANSGKAFVGSYVLGAGFTFDDVAAAKGEAESLATMKALIAKTHATPNGYSPIRRGGSQQFSHPCASSLCN